MSYLEEFARKFIEAKELHDGLCIANRPDDIKDRVAFDLAYRRALKARVQAEIDYEKALDGEISEEVRI